MGGVMQNFRLLNRQASLPLAIVKVSSKPGFCGKAIVSQGRKVNTILCTRSEQVDHKSNISLRHVYKKTHAVRTSMKYCVLVL